MTKARDDDLRMKRIVYEGLGRSSREEEDGREEEEKRWRVTRARWEVVKVKSLRPAVGESSRGHGVYYCIYWPCLYVAALD